MNFKMRILIVFLFAGLLFSCTPPRRSISNGKPISVSGLKFLGELDVPHNQLFKGTTIGGLSGIDYEPGKDLYYIISDDRSAVNPARFYTAKIFFSERGIDSTRFVDVINLLGPDGNIYPNSKQDAAHTPDPEAMRYDRQTNQLIWSSEGERIIKTDNAVLENPAVTIINTDGKYIDTFPLPALLHTQATENGPRRNGVFEGLTFSANYHDLFVNVEEPLYEDGPRAGLTDNNAWIRILKFDMHSKKNTAQYAYKLDPVAHAAIPADSFKINGIPDILWIADNRLMVIERSFSTGVRGCTIKVFVADISAASNIINNPSLKTNTDFKPVTKKLLLNMDSLGIYIDNIEGVTFGPDLPGGKKTLVFISDNNFSPDEKTQLLLFEVLL